MSNRETYPASLSPLTGDINGPAGATQVTVTGIQSIPVDPTTPQAQQLLVMGSDGVWHPEDPVVSGTDAPGTPPTKNPVQIAGIDQNGNVQELAVTDAGDLSIRNDLQEIVRLLRVLIAQGNNQSIALNALPVNPSDSPIF